MRWPAEPTKACIGRGASMVACVAAPPLTWLYAPASRPELVAKALASDAHAVIVDLEDAVPPSAKEAAREEAAALLATPVDKPVFVRVNGLGTEWHHDDVAALATTAIDGIVVPKVESAADVELICGNCDPTWQVHCLLESARGVLRAFEIAVHPRVSGISLGEADLAAETGAAALDWPRAQVVLAAVAAGLPRPPQAVYTRVADLEGLRESCRAGRALGQLGRRAIHPSQLPVIVDEYRPSAEEAHEAERLIALGASGRVAGDRFVDAAALRGAEVTVALAHAYGTTP